MGRSAASSSIDSNSTTSSSNNTNTNNIDQYSHCRTDLSTDLRLGLTISPSHNHSLSSTTLTSTQREQCLDWPPIKHLLRTSLAAGKAATRHQKESLFVKVYMEGIPIGRKLDLFAHKGYNDLIKTLCQMFSTTILCLETDRLHSNKYHVLTYEDQDGDWMMVGDVPWEMFTTSVKRLKITRADRC